MRTCILLILISLFSLSGCSSVSQQVGEWVGLTTKDSTAFKSVRRKRAKARRKNLVQDTSKVAVEPLVVPEAQNVTDVEVIWAIPEDPVDRYLLRYGYSKEGLSQEVSVETADLERYESAQHGFVYRHIISGVEANKPVYVTIAAERAGKVSVASEPFEASAIGKTTESQS